MFSISENCVSSTFVNMLYPLVIFYNASDIYIYCICICKKILIMKIFRLSKNISPVTKYCFENNLNFYY